MTVAKSERILNLFFVLLNSKKPIARRDIRQKVSGYEFCESDTAFERMFERDKDELRSIGLVIQTLPMDSLFENELGYQIDSSVFLTKEIKWDAKDRSILSLASTIWRKSEFESLAKSAAIKTGSKFTSINGNGVEENYSKNLDNYRTILKSMQDKNLLEFNYLSLADKTPTKRSVIAKRLFRKSSQWYMEAVDIKTVGVKNYQINRIFGQINVKPASDLEVNLLKRTSETTNEVSSVTIKINQNAFLVTHITGGKAIDENQIRFEYYDQTAFVNYILGLSSIIVDFDDPGLKKRYQKELGQFLEVLHD